MRRGILACYGKGDLAAAVAAEAARRGMKSHGGFADLHVFAGEDIAVRSLPEGALVLGDIFSRTGGTCRAPGDGWGNYLAFEAAGRPVRIQRAPLTGMPFFWMRIGNAFLGATHLELIAGLIARPSINWPTIANALVYPNLRTEQTGLAGLAELLPGMSLELSAGATRTASVWIPWDHVAPDGRGIYDLAPLLEHRLIGCTASWSSTRSDIVLELSGGLDSSIVAAALAAAGADFTALTFVTPGADGDERVFARAVAKHCGVELVELPHDDRGIDLVAPPAALQPRPGAYGVLGGIDRAFEGAGLPPGAAIFGGIGGDNVFAFDTSVAPVLDAYAEFGLGRRAFATARDVARAGSSTLWQALRLALRAQRAGPRGWRRETSFCNARHLPGTPPPHPWDADAERFPRGKRNHVAAIRRILDFLDRPGRWQNRDVVAPLLSQPFVELCLSIPSWTWLHGGRDRAAARAAFAGRLPANVIWRRGKGQLETLCAAAYFTQRESIRKLLLDGRLTDRGLIDRAAIETYLAHELREGDFDYLRLLEIVDIERWVRSVDAASFGPSIRQR